MPSLKSIARRLSDRAFGTAFDHALARSRHERRNAFLFYWNRGMGDVALCLVPLFARIRREAPGARIAVITREELKEPFELTGIDEVHVIPGLQREAISPAPAPRWASISTRLAPSLTIRIPTAGWRASATNTHPRCPGIRNGMSAPTAH